MAKASTILLADDDKLTLNVLNDTLTRAGYNVITATDGEVAWKKLQEADAQVAILDWIMPGMEGIEICRRANGDPQMANRYFILLTGKSSTEDLVAGLQAGASDYLRKPFDEPELLARVEVGVRFVELQRKLAERVQELERALTQVRRLEGLLPICSYCKRIRNEQDYWERVDAYISQHANVRFSHNICPECYTKHVAKNQ
ncbi:MAG TPA: response regulator [Longimicrobiales bacterium]|nr:response regulator [Longimicrobiales bacterium]